MIFPNFIVGAKEAGPLALLSDEHGLRTMLLITILHREYISLPNSTLNFFGKYMTTSAEYVEQSKELQSLAETARKNEIDGAIKTIKDLMTLHGVTVGDLSSARGTRPAKAKSTVAAQFKNPETGETWTGRGRAPRCLDGKIKEQFRIKN